MDEQELHKLLEYLKGLKLTYRDRLFFSPDIHFGLDMQFLDTNPKKIEKCVKEANKIFHTDKNDKFYASYNKTFSTLLKDKSEVELDTPIFGNTKEFFENLKNLLELFKNRNLTFGVNKGMHIHVDLSAFQEDINILITFLKMFTVYENIIFRFGYGNSNESNSNIATYSRPSSVILHKFISESGRNYSISDNVTKLQQLLTCKSYSLNFHSHDSAVKNDTLEFRMFNNTFDPVVVQNYISLIGNMVDSIVNKKIDMDMFDYIYSQYNPSNYTLEKYSNVDSNGAIEFSDLVFQTSMDKDYFLRQYFIKEEPKIKKLVS